MGDLAKNIAKRAAYLAKQQPLELPFNVRDMAIKVQAMVKLSLDALVNSSSSIARQVHMDDDAVDNYRESIRDQIMKTIKGHAGTCQSTFSSSHFVSKHLERIADMATNIAEDVIYMVEGEIVRHRSERVPALPQR